MIALITGGARSGKSDFAERYAAVLGRSGVYLATSEIWDEEMAERIAKHQQERECSGFTWRTVEVPLHLPETLLEQGDHLGKEEVLLVDCLTLWLTNVLLERQVDGSYPDVSHKPERQAAADRAKAALQRLTDALAVLNDKGVHVLLVTNEVGDGIVPDYPLGRLFRDWAGAMNRRVAACSNQVFLVTAGIPVELKRLAFQLPLPGEQL